MHGKERAMAPLLMRFLGLTAEVAPGLDTDAFGAFSRETARTVSPLEAARGKIAAAFDRVPSATLGLASEGSFGGHPRIPFLPFGQELVLLIDRRSGLELVGRHGSARTNFGHLVVTDPEAGLAFARQIGFPGHGVILTAWVDEQPTPGIALIKDVANEASLARGIERIVGQAGAVLVETDMRADRNPTRMRAIRRATLDLVRRSRSLCPTCAWPGFAVTEHLAGLPCADCGEPTLEIRAEILTCAGCGHREARLMPRRAADPGQCGDCNP
jgi:hypothetical protein